MKHTEQMPRREENEGDRRREMERATDAQNDCATRVPFREYVVLIWKQPFLNRSAVPSYRFWPRSRSR